MKGEVFKWHTSTGYGYQGQWGWRLKARNGEIVCQSEGYTRRYDAKRALVRFIAAVQKLEME